jgi:hypothetical protein
MLSYEVVVVRTADIAAASMGDCMSEMRNWLDRQGIDLANFRSVSLDEGKIAFDAHFREAEQADRFRATFGSRPVSGNAFLIR